VATNPLPCAVGWRAPSVSRSDSIPWPDRRSTTAENSPRRIDQLDPKGHAGHHSKIWNQIQPSAESHAHGHPDGTRRDAGRHARALAAFDPASQINRSVEEQAHRLAAAGLAG